MKKLLAILVLGLLFISTLSFADDIRDFQIEGMSLGDSLLDYFSEDEIKDNIMTGYYSHKDRSFKFMAIELYNFPFFETYSGIQVHVKKNDKKYIIYNLSGFDFYTNNIENCYKKQKEIDKELSVLFKDEERRVAEFKLSADESKKSTTKQIYYELKSGDSASVSCYDWSEIITNTKNWADNIEVALDTKEFFDAIVKK